MFWTDCEWFSYNRIKGAVTLTIFAGEIQAFQYESTQIKNDFCPEFHDCDHTLKFRLWINQCFELICWMNNSSLVATYWSKDVTCRKSHCKTHNTNTQTYGVPKGTRWRKKFEIGGKNIFQNLYFLSQMFWDPPRNLAFARKCFARERKTFAREPNFPFGTLYRCIYC